MAREDYWDLVTELADALEWAIKAIDFREPEDMDKLDNIALDKAKAALKKAGR